MKKYPKTTGYYPYYHRLPNKMCYFGMSNQQPSKRWTPSSYKTTALGPYIEEIGWDNIEHGIITDGLTKHQAEVIEDWFIKNAIKDGFCLNKQRSGGRYRDNKREYKREYRKTVKYQEYHREYEKTEKRKVYLHEYRQRPEVKQHRRELQRQYRLKKKQEKLLSDNISAFDH